MLLWLPLRRPPVLLPCGLRIPRPSARGCALFCALQHNGQVVQLHRTCTRRAHCGQNAISPRGIRVSRDCACAATAAAGESQRGEGCGRCSGAWQRELGYHVVVQCIHTLPGTSSRVGYKRTGFKTLRALLWRSRARTARRRSCARVLPPCHLSTRVSHFLRDECHADILP